MSSNQYLASVIKKYQVDSGKAFTYYNFFLPQIQEWAGSDLRDVKISGSSAKGTAIRNGTDVDIFISITSATAHTLGNIYETLFNYMDAKGFKVRKQNVSLGITYNNDKIDLVPARRIDQYGREHNLYVRKLGTWRQTNIDAHISKVQGSNRINEIRLTKIWRDLNNLDFPSFYLELIVIEALSGKLYNDLANNFLTVLQYLASSFPSRLVIDPANSANRISDLLSDSEKKKIASAAQVSLAKDTWQKIVW